MFRKPISNCLVADTGQVIGKGLDGGGGVSGDLCLSVVANDNGLLGLGDSDTDTALFQYISIPFLLGAVD